MTESDAAVEQGLDEEALRVERDRLDERREQVEQDLRELDEQVSLGEIDALTADRLRDGYLAELRRVEDERSSPTRLLARPSRRRAVAGTVLVVGAFALVAVLAAQAITPREGNFVTGFDNGGADADPGSVSNEQMEAVIAANLDDPQINGMRMALAGRYFQEGSFSQALDHYLAVLDGEPTSPQAAVALGRVGWMSYASGEPGTGRDFLERALEVEPEYAEGVFFLAEVLLCGFDDTAGALELLDDLAATPGLPPEVLTPVEEAADAARAGTACPP